MIVKKIQYSFKDADLTDLDNVVTQKHLYDMNREIIEMRKGSKGINFFGDEVTGEVFVISNSLEVVGDDEQVLLVIALSFSDGPIIKRYFAPDCTIEVELTEYKTLFVRQVVEDKESAAQRYLDEKHLQDGEEKEPDIDKIAKKMCELLAGAQSNYNPIKDVKPASLPKILVDGVACPLPAVVTLSLSEAEELVHENKDELLARQRNDRKGIEYHLS